MLNFSFFIYRESQQYSQYLHPFKLWFAIHHRTVLLRASKYLNRCCCLLVCTCFNIQIQRFWFYGFEPQGHWVTTVAPSPGAPSQLVAATDGVWPTQAARQTYACVTGCVFVRDLWSLVHWSVCILSGCTCCGACARSAWPQSALVCVRACAHVAMFRCSVRVLKPVVSVVASVTLTASLSTQELLSHAGCFCQSWAEAVTPQRFTALCALSCWRLSSCSCIFSAEQTAPCWQLRAVKTFIRRSDLDLI